MLTQSEAYFVSLLALPMRRLAEHKELGGNTAEAAGPK